jgi:hypothetical protein
MYVNETQRDELFEEYIFCLVIVCHGPCYMCDNPCDSKLPDIVCLVKIIDSVEQSPEASDTLPTSQVLP